ncbi:MAG TPA: prepilin-type N-terminal cleavage/methylation domain-containing protein [Rudaea sp.]
MTFQRAHRGTNPRGVSRSSTCARSAIARGARPTFQKSRGFTLIEIVAAFVIFALGFGVLLQILSSSLHTTTQSADYTKAALWAQSLLDTQGIGEKLEETSTSGNFDNQYRWQLRISKYDPPPVAAAAQAPAPGNPQFGNVVGGQVGTPLQGQFEMYQLELVVSWGTAYLTHNARFTTLRVINPNQQLPGAAPGLQAPNQLRTGQRG